MSIITSNLIRMRAHKAWCIGKSKKGHKGDLITTPVHQMLVGDNVPLVVITGKKESKQEEEK